MISKLFVAILVSGLSFHAFAGSVLDDQSYVQAEGKSCFDLVKAAALKAVPAAKKAAVVYPLSHISTTQGTYNQVFISVVNVDSDYYTMVSEGEYSCDNMTVVSVQKIKIP